VVIIKNGDLKEYITPGASKEDFVRRIHTAFDAAPQAAALSNQSQTTAATSTTHHQHQQPAQQNLPTTAPPPYEATRSENVQRVLTERAARLQTQKEEAERKAKEERAKTADKAKAEAEAGADTDAARAYKQAELVKKKKQKDREERDRILKRIEDDKEERRQRAIERERQRIDNQKIGDVAAALVNSPETKLPSTTRLSDLTSIQVRLFDGSTIRSRFKTTAPLKEVRQWVDEKRPDGNLPYTFKQVLTPLPNKNLDATEESKELGELGLAPSSTLVLVPVANFTDAYDGGGNIFSRLLRMIFGFFAIILGLFGVGGERRAERRESASLGSGQGAATAQGDSRVRGLQNMNDRRDQQLYNGNSVSTNHGH
jgi:hypothetical protein